MDISRDMLLTILTACSEKIISEKEFLDELDTPIGDSDHGVNMARGFSLALEKMDTVKDKTMYDILNTIAMTLISNVGGASGPLYGTAFMKAAKETKDKDLLTAHDLVGIYEAVIAGIKMRGQAEKGCKTMLDAIIPAYEAFKSAVDDGKPMSEAATLATQAADNGVEYTKTIIATKGRASYLGERSIGHQDPGATSSAMIIKVISEHLV